MPPRQMRMLCGNIRLETALKFIHSTFPTIKTNLDRTVSYIFLKIKICRKESHFEFAVCFLVKNLAVKFKIMVVELSNHILQSALLISQQHSYLNVTFLTSRTLSFLWVSGSPRSHRELHIPPERKKFLGSQ